MDTCTINILSLCSGVGGLDLGLKLAIPKSRVVCYVEREAYCCEVLASRMEDKTLDEAPIWTDARTFNGRPWSGIVDIVIGGYPCQPFSVAGKLQGEKDPRHLWPDIKRIVGEVRPRFCFFENVANHLRMGFEQVHDDLREMGYRVKAGLFTAEEVGAPHKRDRLFIVADSEKLTERKQDDQTCPQPREDSRKNPGWRDWWSSEPQLGRVANGVPDRIDRLRAIGNGVVPEVARVAWETLTS